MKNALRIFALVLALCMTLSLMSCDVLDKVFNKGNDDNNTNNGGNTANQNVVALAGDYILDGTDYGMAKQWFIKIGADETFKISSQKDFSDDKGNGSVKEQSGTFMFIYSDSTAESAKTATFTVVDGNLVFSTAIPVGSVNFKNQNENSDGTIVVYPEGKVPDVVGSFAGEMDKTSGMGGSVHYDFTFDVKANGTYTYTSTFTMMGETYVYAEEGLVTVKDSVVTVKALKNVTSANIETGTLTDIAAENQTEVTGSIADNVITINMKPSPMSSSPVEAKLYLVPSYAGVYYGELDKASGMGGSVHYDFLFEIKYNNTYKYSSTFTMMGETYVYAEEGTITENNYNLSVTALKKVTAATMESGTLVDVAEADRVTETGSLGMGGKLSLNMKPSPMSSSSVAITLNPLPDYVASYTGELDKASGMGGSIHYDFTFDIKANGTFKYTSSFEMGQETYVYAEEGTVKVEDGEVTIKALKKVAAADIESGTLTDIAVGDQTEVVGTLTDGVISISMKLSPMSSTASDITLSK